MSPRLLSVRILAATAALSLAAPAMAQITTDPGKIAAGAYVVDPAHTQITFGVSHMGFTTYYGRLSGASGKLSLTPETPTGSAVEVAVPTASISTTSEKLDGELKSADWLDAGKFPTVTFRSTSVKSTGPTTADITGDLTLHGVTHPVLLAATLNGAGPNPFFKVLTVGFQATGTIKRSDFGVKTYLPAIGDEVALTIGATFVKP